MLCWRHARDSAKLGAPSTVDRTRWCKAELSTRRTMNRVTLLHGLMAAPAGLGPILQGADAPERIQVGGATIDIYIDSGQSELGKADLLEWVTRSARAVTAYFGR